ncbi:AMP-binding protein [Brevibacterium sp. 5221]|uniref:AMP-binding protein n=1 Tax=Brevibacterium rongguiense TaxID=2695267 RepID=A0A6N9HA01_9MICO|nr:AMP-binding protein [Brevibacterium rongguiense]MYM20920.1 AMP-binding protein [Brevibacterium rongguiense]
MAQIVGRSPEWYAAYSGPDVSAAHLLCDRHDPDTTAFTFVDDELAVTAMSYGELAERSRRLATDLAARGVVAGQRVGVLMTKRPELVVSLVALARLGAVYVPLFTAFATAAIDMRMRASQARLVLTEPSQEDKLEGLDYLDVLSAGPEFDAAQTRPEPYRDDAALGGDGLLLQLFTSGTTGKPKGVPVPIRALASFQVYMEDSLDVRPDDIFWNAADPGWAYGLYYGVCGPLTTGLPNILYSGRFRPASTYEVMEACGVTNFAGAPTIYRELSKSGVEPHVRLRCASSAGEPLTADVSVWAQRALGTEVRDHYGQTELGMVICNQWAEPFKRPVKPDSMGREIAGYRADIVDGGIAIDVEGSPLLWFEGYVGAPDKTAERFSADGRWYLTGDTGRRDEDGDFYFTARDDDIILMAGYRIGPFDVESVLITHPDVVDVAVVGRPDPEGIRGEIAEAFVVLAPGREASDELTAELKDRVREGYSHHAYPRRVHYVDTLPKTPSGKLQRYLLRQGED